MKNLRGYIYIFLFSLGACKAKNDNIFYVSQKDTLLKQYLLQFDSFPYPDTTDTNFQVLRAYYQNDTAQVRNIILSLKNQNEYEQYFIDLDTSVQQEKLQDLGVDEAYRFIYLPAFCSMPINVTIAKKGDSSKMYFLLYQNRYDTLQFRVISKFEKPLTQNQWEEFRSLTQWGDIWGLKRDNGIRGVDGTHLTFIAYQSGKPWNRADRIRYGIRWSYSSLNEALTYILKISGNTKGCEWIK